MLRNLIHMGRESRITVVHMEKDMQAMIITIALLTQKNVSVAQCTEVGSPKCSNCWPSLFTHSYSLLPVLKYTLAWSSYVLLPTPGHLSNSLDLWKVL